ncbi:MAG: ABC transporter ATP-binding protein [Actinomycetota bacterium]|nr:ABC transporter ATP-binding protein [Actinomycetota bacterium]
MTVLTVSGLRKAFARRVVIGGIDLDVAAGQRIGLHGPNGSGKTTFLRCVTGSLSPDHGRVEIEGSRAGSVAALMRLGCSLSQEKSFYLRLDGRRNLEFFARLKHRDAAAARADVSAVVDELQIHDIVRVRADRCSSGMVQQLGLARALLGDPKIIVLDEPTKSMDEGAVARLWGAIERRPDLAVLLASHRKEDLMRCGDVVEFPH